MAKLGPGVQLVKVGRTAKPEVRKADTTTVLVRKLAKALSKPGIDRSVVFSGPDPSKVYAFSVYPSDPTLIVRESFDGTRVVGRFVDGKFRASTRAPKTANTASASRTDARRKARGVRAGRS
ncbi:hypothetical protein LK996_05280 [Lysobacter sp. A6]|uniref:Uncharacterized protein n=1 Tax=Noviluteimonas lactosilytica TaxID=2888523 RepID=A0ABS8JG03_9GAMM|nr:hypothetical protein [Lysobacter lactosilyticus]MCC8362484.1 hypothetical protein [Lysobacter lactosilyticus]